VSFALKSTAELREIVDRAKADIERSWRDLHLAQAEITKRSTWAARDRLARLDEHGKPIRNPVPPALSHEERADSREAS
jgi:hypothetical protein